MNGQDYVPGEPKNSYENNPAYARDLLGFIVLFGLIGLAAVIIGLRQDDPRSVLLIIGGLLFGATGVWLYTVYKGRLKMKAAVYEQGFSLTDPRGRSVFCRWDDITEVYETVIYSGRRMSHPRWWKYTVCRGNAEPLQLNSAILHVNRLGASIQQEVNQRLLPQILERYQTGETVAFGPHIAFSRQGIWAGQKVLPWNQVAEVGFSGLGNLQIKQNGRHLAWKIVTHAQIANFPTLKEMLSRIEKPKPPTQQPLRGPQDPNRQG